MLENFVTKHLKLSVKVAEQLNTKQFVEQSMYQADEKTEADQNNKDPRILNVDDGQKQIKIYDSQEKIEMKHLNGGVVSNNEGTQIAENFQPMGHTLDAA